MELSSDWTQPAAQTGKTYREALEVLVKSGPTDDYSLIQRIGSGRYGEVFAAINVTTDKKYAIKVLKPVRIEKVIREIKVLNHLKGGPNVIALKDTIVNSGVPALVFPFVSDQTLKTVATSLSEQEIRLYLYKLLRAIDFTHKHNVIHRDIKPSNVMIDRYRGVLRLIDWGLADFYVTDKIYPVTVASRFYKPPELLLGYHKYDFALDMWSFGCVAAALIFKREPFFNGLDNLDQLKKIVSVLGNDCLKQYVLKYQLKPTVQYLMEGIIQRRQWREFLSHTQTSLAVNDITLDLIDKLLVFDHKFRLTADEALRHPFFSMKTEKMG